MHRVGVFVSLLWSFTVISRTRRRGAHPQDTALTIATSREGNRGGCSCKTAAAPRAPPSGFRHTPLCERAGFFCFRQGKRPLPRQPFVRRTPSACVGRGGGGWGRGGGRLPRQGACPRTFRSRTCSAPPASLSSCDSGVQRQLHPAQSPLLAVTPTKSPGPALGEIANMHRSKRRRRDTDQAWQKSPESGGRTPHHNPCAVQTTENPARASWKAILEEAQHAQRASPLLLVY